jgi:hypothetical protein
MAAKRTLLIPMRDPAALAAPTPKRGVEFLHSRLLDAEDPAKPARCVVTAVRQGCVYYKFADRRGRGEYCTLERWPLIASAIPETSHAVTDSTDNLYATRNSHTR